MDHQYVPAELFILKKTRFVVLREQLDNLEQNAQKGG